MEETNKSKLINQGSYKTLRPFLITLLIVQLFCSCGNDKLCYEERELEIIPKIGVGPYHLGMTEDKLKNMLCENHMYQESKPWFSDEIRKFYFLENMSFILKNERVVEINVWGRFNGTFDEIDTDYDKEFLEYYGEVIEHDGEYRILDIPGIAFGLEDGDEGKYIRVFN